MINRFGSSPGKLHDARLYGFLLDLDPKTFNLNVLLYIHLFSDFKSNKYCLEKGLVVFENASIDKFSITNDLGSGQFYIIDYVVENLGNEKFKFTFAFNDSSIDLVITAENIKLITSGLVEEKEEQFLPTDWLNLLN
ncbi:hypothetical protein [Acinetobacter tjernbergiae]|uniref:Uncharacterized protein n=1 Tax=Acinetobacter tjernbergiae DSM 14971 = CIP 107465 TaxID=1120928 RepID=V2V1W0_9GAMM|nr:hypothetical protein [Acinetobacter tjernbergiae]ESK54895.1 hypothetical protein F990_02338 [Acinetobacter tjernbergiae DSM 14971 = CIP 107465]